MLKRVISKSGPNFFLTLMVVEYIVNRMAEYLVGKSGLKQDSYDLKLFLASKKLCNVTENPLEGTLDISKPENIFILRIRTIFGA